MLIKGFITLFVQRLFKGRQMLIKGFITLTIYNVKSYKTITSMIKLKLIDVSIVLNDEKSKRASIERQK